MSQTPESLAQRLRELFAAQTLAVLSTTGADAHPYASLVGFVATNDLKYFLFATARTTRKYANLINNMQVALLIDSRTNRESDFHEAVAVTALGRAEELIGSERNRLLPLFLRKHPHLVDFVNAPSCAFIRIHVKSYYLVSRFQDVVELHLPETL